MKRTIASSLAAALAAAGLTLVASPAGAEPAHAQPPSTAAAVQAADAHVASHPAVVHANSADKLIRTEVEKGANGLRYVQYKRTYHGIPVVGGDVVVMTDADGNVLSTSIAQDQAIDVGTRPKIGADQALRTAKGQLDRVESTTQPRLVVVTSGGQPKLAWETVVHGTLNKLPSKLHVFVDAMSGALASSYDEVKAGTGEGFYVGEVNISTSGSGGSYSMEDPTRPGIQCGGQNGYPYTGSDDRWGNGRGTDLETACVDALYAVQQEWDMLADWLGRDGIDGDGGGFPARVGLNAVNAYWNGSYTNFGHSADGQRQATSMDVVGHEFGHAIFQTTPGGSRGGNETGGINEATGDIFGALTEFYAGNPNDPGDYKVGEEVDLGGSGPIRYMYNPSIVGHPNCYSADIPNTEVHAAAGPLDHWFYLLAEGSNPGGGLPDSPTCDGSSVAGIGIQKAGQVYYNAMLQKTSYWRYVEVRVATLNAAKALYPGCTVFNKVKTAWNAVSVPRQQNEPSCTPDVDNDFAVSVSPPSGTLDAGSSLTATVATQVTKGDPQQVELSASGLPEGVSASFTPRSITAGESAELTLTASETAPAGRYQITVVAAGNETTNSVTFTLTINGASSCTGYTNVHTGQLASGDVAYQPDGGYYYAPAGTHTACLDAPAGTDFDLYLQKWNGWDWVDVASGTTPGPDEQLSYTGTAGYYSYQIHAYNGSGNYTLGFDTP